MFLNAEMNELKLEQLFVIVDTIQQTIGSGMPILMTVHLVGHAGRQSWLTVTLGEQAAVILVQPTCFLDLTVLL
jgi:hypothetical protein